MSTTGNAGRAALTPAQLFALIFGAVLALVGVLGFFVNSDFGNLGSGVQGDDLIVFEVNGWHNVVHLLSGLAGLAVWRNPALARTYALGLGLVYALVTLLGFITGDHIVGLMSTNGPENVLHLLIAITGVGAGLAPTPRPTAAGDAPPTAA